VVAALFIAGIVLGAGACSSSPSADDTPATSAPTSSTPVSVLPSTTTTSNSSTTRGATSRPEACAVLAPTLTIGELQPRDGGNWPAERQRIITDAAVNAMAYEAAARVAPAQLVDPLGVLTIYARFIGDSVAAASSLAAARTAIAAAPNQGVVSSATSTVEGWQRTTCR
jgi:hypothetical protein